MADEINKADICENSKRIANNTTVQNRTLSRFFSVDSNINMTETNIINHATQEDEELNATKNCRGEFLLKILQLLTGIICTSLYSEGVKSMANSPITSICFPNVVFSSTIIITAVIILSYVLRQVMSDLLIRVFNAMALVLYFISATVTITEWNSRKSRDSSVQMTCLLIQSALSYLNSVFYGLDMWCSIKRAIFEF